MSLNRASAGGKSAVREAKKVVSLPPVVKKSSKSRSFHFRYLELCRAKNIAPIAEIRAKSSTTLLELFADKLAVNDWLLINEALYHDLVLQTLIVRVRRILPQNTIEPIDSEKRARLYRQRPVMYTRFIFVALVNAISNCLELNKNLNVLKLEGLPLQESYIETIAKALASNESLVTLSFRKSPIGDKGCSVVCNTAKYLNTIEVFDVSECNLTAKGAEYLADMIKMQKITRFSEGWEQSLRYRSVDVNAIAGLRNILMANNPDIGDDGVKFIAEVLKEDAWVKVVDMESCGITDRGANMILECVEVNNAITDFNVRNNDITKFIYRNIREHLDGPVEEQSEEPQYDLSCINGLQSLPKNKKLTVAQLLNHIKNLEEQLSFERTLRKKAEKLNERLSQHLMSRDNNSPPPTDKLVDTTNVPNGYVIVRNDSLQDIVKETQNYRKTHSHRLVNSTVTSPEGTPRSDIATLRKEQQQQQLSMQEQLKAVPEEESQSESEMADSSQREDQQPRKLLQVRKVRSEMKYVETNVKDNSKNHESKSDHEFANERDFQLNPNIQFETDIGDSVMVSSTQQDRKRNEGGGDVPYGYEETVKNQALGRALAGSHYERGHFGDIRKTGNNDNKRRGSVGSGDGRVAQYMAEIERKSGKKRHKPKMDDNVQHTETYMKMSDIQVETYVSNFDDVELESNLNNSDSEVDTTDATMRGQASNNKFGGMKVFVRRTNKHSVDNQENEDDASGNTDEDITSPRSVFLEMQRKKQEQNS